MKRIVHSIISVAFLLSFLGSQVALTIHNHNTSLSIEHGKGYKSSSLADKCSICDVQSHNHFISADVYVFDFTTVSSKTFCIYKQNYSGIKLVKSSSRSPPNA